MVEQLIAEEKVLPDMVEQLIAEEKVLIPDMVEIEKVLPDMVTFKKEIEKYRQKRQRKQMGFKNKSKLKTNQKAKYLYKIQNVNSSIITLCI